VTAIHVEVAYSGQARVVDVVPLILPAGSTALDALKACDALNRWPELAAAAASAKPQVGVWGKRVVYSHVLHDADRLEIYRPLRVDPKVARRERFAKQGARTTGLFAQRRPGGKAGY
jgi:putative ubiquitin-RnfH superfamily antitoxin RatB of RatAB toxin-antitoxin module